MASSTLLPWLTVPTSGNRYVQIKLSMNYGREIA